MLSRQDQYQRKRELSEELSDRWISNNFPATPDWSTYWIQTAHKPEMLKQSITLSLEHIWMEHWNMIHKNSSFQT